MKCSVNGENNSYKGFSCHNLIFFRYSGDQFRLTNYGSCKLSHAKDLPKKFNGNIEGNRTCIPHGNPE